MTKKRTRARSDVQKTARREQILDAAACLFAEQKLESVTVAQIAQRAELAKGTVYLYFRTKEELFLELLGNWLLEWFDALDAGFSDKKHSPETGAAHVCDTLLARSNMLALIPYVHAVLERNVTMEAVMSFKLPIHDRAKRTGALLENSLDGLPSGEGYKLCRRVFALVLGIQQICDPMPSHRASYNEPPELAGLIPDFGTELYETLESMMRGMVARG